MQIVALIHTEGVLLNKKYFVLELTYIDIQQEKRHFLIRSPISFNIAQKTQKHLFKSLETIMCQKKMYNGYKTYHISEVKHFLRQKYLSFNHCEHACFGYKGKSFQKEILKKCYIPNINIEKFGIPSIRTLMAMYPNIENTCCFHKKIHDKCSSHIIRLICTHISTIAPKFNFNPLLCLAQLQYQ